MDPWLRHHLLVLSEHVISNTEVVFGAWIPPNTCWRHLCWMWHKKKPKSKITYGFGVYCHLDSYRFQLSCFHMCALLAGWAVWEGRLLTFLGLRFLRCPHCSVRRFRRANFVHQPLKMLHLETAVTQPWVVPKQAEESCVYEHECALGWCCGFKWNHFFSDIYSRMIVSASSLSL